jgi:hypothetical protein
MGEGHARRLSFAGGIFFGIGWLVFIDSLAHFNACLDSGTHSEEYDVIDFLSISVSTIRGR